MLHNRGLGSWPARRAAMSPQRPALLFGDEVTTYAQLRERIAQLREEISGLTAQQQSKSEEIGYITEELSGVEQLYAKNLVSIARLKQLQRDKARLMREKG